MKTLLIGLVVGGISGFAVQKYALTDDTEGYRQRRTTNGDERVERDVKEVPTDHADLLERIRELEALLAARGDAVDLSIDYGDVKVPETDEEIDLLMQEWTETDDLDKLLALLRALLLKGERGYPKLTKVLVRFVGKVMMRKYRQEDLMQKAVGAFKLAMRHEKELVGYVGYLLTAEDVPADMKTGAMAGAMFLSLNGVKGSERFAPLLLEAFMAKSGGMNRDQAQMLILAMGMMKQEESVEPMLRMLDDPAKQRLHGGVIEALGNIGDERAVGPLVKRLQTTSPDTWWLPEIRALAKIGTPEAKAAAERYIKGVENDDRFFFHAGNFLSQQYSAAVVAEVRDRYRKNPGANNMWQVMRGLSQSGRREAITLLEEISKTSTQDWVKRQAGRFLEERKKAESNVAASER